MTVKPSDGPAVGTHRLG